MWEMQPSSFCPLPLVYNVTPNLCYAIFLHGYNISVLYTIITQQITVFWNILLYLWYFLKVGHLPMAYKGSFAHLYTVSSFNRKQ